MVVWQLWGPSVCRSDYFLNLLPPPVAACILTKGRTLLATISSYWCLSPPECLKPTMEFSLVTKVPICCLKAALIFYVFLFHLLGLQRPWRNGIAGWGSAMFNQTQGPPLILAHTRFFRRYSTNPIPAAPLCEVWDLVIQQLGLESLVLHSLKYVCCYWLWPSLVLWYPTLPNLILNYVSVCVHSRTQ